MSLQSRLTSLVSAIGADIKQLRTQVDEFYAKEIMDSGTVGGLPPSDTVDAGAATGSQPLGLIDGGTDVMVSITKFVDGGETPFEEYEGHLLYGEGPNTIVSPTDPGLTEPGLWIQTGLGPNGTGYTFWIEDGTL